MILIADSGSTKTHWCVTDNNTKLVEVFTDGINPYYQSTEDIARIIAQQLMPALDKYYFTEVFFYGAGCAFPDKKEIVSNALTLLGEHLSISIFNDLLGASRALFQHEKGIACIMGTGSNSCYYDGNEITQNISPLGFILGDEGSGAVLGKLFVADCLKNQIPEWIRDKFMDEYELTPALILDRVYKQPFPNRFLAGFAPFLLEHISEAAIFNLVYDAFDAFLVRNVLQYPVEDIKIGFVGSIAWHFSETLEIVISEQGLEMGSILKSPMEGLIQFHSA